MKKITLPAMFALIFSSICFSETIHVPGDQPTVQAGIDAAVTGDTVLVAPGKYVELLDFKGKDIILTSEQGPELTILDGDRLGSVLTIKDVSGSMAEVSGFTILNGQALDGAGIFCVDSSPFICNNIIKNNIAVNKGGGISGNVCSSTIVDNIIKNNHADGRGGGIHCAEGSPLIIDNEIDSNYTHSKGGGIYVELSDSEIRGNLITNNEGRVGGGGISTYYGNPLIVENTISNNFTSVLYARGGAIEFFSVHLQATIAHNIITHNLANTGGGLSIFALTPITVKENEIAFNRAEDFGGGLDCNSYCHYFLDNRIVHNDAVLGGGVFFRSGSRPMFTGNTVARNTALDGGGLYMEHAYSPACIPSLRNNLIASNEALFRGGGLLCDDSHPKFINNTFVDNTAGSSGGGLCLTDTSEPVITNTIIWNNDAPLGAQIHLDNADAVVSYTNIQDGWPGTGNITTDPLFVNALQNDYHLTYDSPCRDAGDNTPVKEPEDFEGDLRIAFGTVDLGADEFYTHLYCTGDFTPGGSIEGKFVGLPGTTPVGLFIGSGVLDPPLSHKWGDFHLEAPWLLFALVPIPANGVLSIPSTIPTVPGAPHDRFMQALIGWELSNLFVLEVR